MYRAKKREIAIMNVRFAATAVVFTLGACASTPPNPSDPGSIADPYEGFNRQMFAFNNGVDKYALGPAADAYETVTPRFARDRIGDFLRNLRAPVIFVNDVLQAEPSRAADTFVRFTINTTVGVAGLWDAADHFGVEHHSEDFGQTLAVWGVDSGPYLVMPIMGPTTPRDLFGSGVDRALDPLTWTEFDGDPDLDDKIAISRGVLSGLNARVALDDQIEQLNSQPEPYVALRRIYSSQRQAEIRNGRPEDESEMYEDLPDFDEFDQ
ncbi:MULTISPECIES: MlaA family lipoprotein [Hyphomonas]|uniref:Putative lipoprotein VacJ n=1 Tax=Hyphomonas jannaschiana VP2 TaxID=1280952 RepID=A0A059F771_9PROT|nr:VacJ family lipoprotein [Hyphomonas jannaschiana]KCZ86436.1 putative lipoprotein VacJ [Hyphomonas jannaschiana VP2]